MSILRVFEEHGVEYVVAGASAVWLHDIDRSLVSALEICYRQAWNNCECLTRALDEIGAKTIPPLSVPIPVTADLRKAREPLHFETPAGLLTLLPTVPGLGSFDDLSPEATVVEAAELRMPALSLEQLQRWATAHPSGDLPFLGRLLSLQQRGSEPAEVEDPDEDKTTADDDEEEKEDEE